MTAVLEQTRVLPKTDKIKIKFNWTPIESIWGCHSTDLGELTLEALQVKANDVNFDDLVQSISDEGFYDPVYFEGISFGNGHHRLLACVILGYTHIPTTDNKYLQWEENAEVVTIHECINYPCYCGEEINYDEDDYNGQY